MRPPMRLYPVFLDLRRKEVLLVGGGRAAARRARALLAARARVTVAAPSLASGFPRGVRHLAREYRAPDLAGKALVLALSEDPEANAEALRDARAAGIPAHSRDDRKGSDVHLPSVVRRGPLAIAVSSGGGFPGLSRRVARDLRLAYGPGHAVHLRLLRRLRPLVSREIGDGPLRRAVLRRMARPELAELCGREGEAAGRHALLALLREAVRS